MERDLRFSITIAHLVPNETLRTQRRIFIEINWTKIFLVNSGARKRHGAER